MAQLVAVVRDLLLALYRPEANGVRLGRRRGACRRGGGPGRAGQAAGAVACGLHEHRLPAWDVAARHAKAGHPAFFYEFARPLAPPAHGVPRTAEIPFVFGTFADPFFAAKAGSGPDPRPGRAPCCKPGRGWPARPLQ